METWTDEFGRTLRVMAPGKFRWKGSRYETPRRTSNGRLCEAVELVGRDGRASFFCWRMVR